MRASCLIIGITALLTSGCSNSQQQPAENTTAQQPAATPAASDKNPAYPVASLCKTWLVQNITIDGVEDTLYYAGSNDEMTLHSDMSFNAIDRTYDDSLSGKWSLVDGNKIVLEQSSSAEPSRFEIVSMTDDSLVTKLLEADDVEIKIFYTAKK